MRLTLDRWMRKAGLTCGAAVLLAAPVMAQIDLPVLGLVSDAQGNLRRVSGLAGTFALGNALESGVLAAGWTGRSGLVKTEGELLLLDEKAEVTDRRAAPAGMARFVFDRAGMPAEVRFASGEVWRWKKDEGFQAIDQPELDDAPMTLQDGRTIRLEDDAVVVEPAGVRLTLPREATTVERMGAEWLVLRTAHGPLLLVHMAARREQIYELPEVAQ